jgi:hypothetical protein
LAQGALVARRVYKVKEVTETIPFFLLLHLLVAV